MPAFRGFLQRPINVDEETQAVLLLVDQINKEARMQTKGHPQSTVLLIDDEASLEPARIYLRGLKGVDSIRTICKRQDCTGVTDAE